MGELFIVPKTARPQQPSPEADAESFQVTGDTLADLETALRALAFLLEWMLRSGPEECAVVTRAWREANAPDETRE